MSVAVTPFIGLFSHMDVFKTLALDLSMVLAASATSLVSRFAEEFVKQTIGISRNMLVRVPSQS